MSECISSHGEYSEHKLTGTGAERFTCQRCWVEDHEAAMDALAAAEAVIAQVRELHQSITAGPDRGFCDGCDERWPCTTAAIVGAGTPAQATDADRQ